MSVKYYYTRIIKYSKCLFYYLNIYYTTKYTKFLSMLQSIKDIRHVMYINLESRPDRKELLLTELSKLNLECSPIWFKAIKTTNGAVGCTLSHIRCLEIAKEQNWPHLLLVEDDIEFTDPNLFVCSLNTFLKSNTPWNVVLVAGNNAGPYRFIPSCAAQVIGCQTTTGYMVKSDYYDSLITNYKEGLTKLMREPHLRINYAIDRYWFSLQKKDLWYLIYPLTVTQRSDYSDIEGREVNYKKMMLTLDKSTWNIKPPSPKMTSPKMNYSTK